MLAKSLLVAIRYVLIMVALAESRLLLGVVRPGDCSQGRGSGYRYWKIRRLEGD